MLRESPGRSFLMQRLVCSLVLCGLCMTPIRGDEPKPFTYPDTKRVEQFDDFHGTKVADPYRWLEDDVRTSKDVANWVEAQNKVTQAYLNAIPERERIQRR